MWRGLGAALRVFAVNLEAVLTYRYPPYHHHWPFGDTRLWSSCDTRRLSRPTCPIIEPAAFPSEGALGDCSSACVWTVPSGNRHVPPRCFLWPLHGLRGPPASTWRSQGRREESCFPDKEPRAQAQLTRPPEVMWPVSEVPRLTFGFQTSRPQAPVPSHAHLIAWFTVCDQWVLIIVAGFQEKDSRLEVATV